VKRLAGYPHWFYAAIMTVIAGLVFTGIALVPSMLAMRLDIETTWRIEGGARLLAAAGHCAAGFLMVGITASLMVVHVRLGWRRHRNRISGATLLALSLVLLVSTLGIYYLGDEQWSRLSSVTHTSTGLLLVLVFVWHSIKGRRLRRKQNPLSAADRATRAGPSSSAISPTSTRVTGAGTPARRNGSKSRCLI